MVSAISNIAATGLQVARNELEVAANNIANLNTPGFRSSRSTSVPLPTGGARSVVRQTTEPGPEIRLEDGSSLVLSNTDLVTEQISLIASRAAFHANLAVMKTANEMERSLIDILA